MRGTEVIFSSGQDTAIVKSRESNPRCRMILASTVWIISFGLERKEGKRIKMKRVAVQGREDIMQIPKLRKFYAGEARGRRSSQAGKASQD